MGGCVGNSSATQCVGNSSVGNSSVVGGCVGNSSASHSTLVRDLWRDENREVDSQNAGPLRHMDLYESRLQRSSGDREHRVLSSVSRVLWFVV